MNKCTLIIYPHQVNRLKERLLLTFTVNCSSRLSTTNSSNVIRHFYHPLVHLQLKVNKIVLTGQNNFVMS